MFRFTNETQSVNRSVFLFLIVFLQLVFTVNAAEIHGRFTVDGSVIAGAPVILYDRNLNELSSSETDSSGSYRLFFNEPGIYFLNAASGQASTGFYELDLELVDEQLDINLLITKKTIELQGHVSTVDGTPLSFTEISVSSESASIEHERIVTDKYGNYSASIDIPNFDDELTFEAWVMGGISDLNNGESRLPVYATKQTTSKFVASEELAVEQNIVLPNFAKQTLKISSLDGAGFTASVTLYQVEDDGSRFRLGNTLVDASGLFDFYFPLITEDNATELAFSIQPPNAVVGDYNVELLNQDQNPFLAVSFNKNINPEQQLSSVLSGQVQIQNEQGLLVNNSSTVSVMNNQYELISVVESDNSGVFTLDLETWGQYFIRAENAAYKSPWQSIVVNNALFEHDILLDTSFNIVDVNGVIKTTNDLTLGGVDVVFSADELPVAFYSFGGQSNPSVVTNALGEFVISLPTQVASEGDAFIQYKATVESRGRRLKINNQASSFITYIPETHFSIDPSETNPTFILPAIHKLNLVTLDPQNSPIDLFVNLSLSNGDWLTSLATDVAGSSTLYLAGVDGLGSNIEYNLIPEIPNNNKATWFPPEITNIVITEETTHSILLNAKRTVNVSGNVTDLNGNAIVGATIGFSTTDLDVDDYTAGYGRYYPHHISTNTGYEIALRANNSLTQYTARLGNCATCNDKWGFVNDDGRHIEAYWGNTVLSQQVDLAGDSTLQVSDLQLSVDLKKLTLNVVDTNGLALYDIAVSLYLNSNSSTLIKNFRSDKNGQVVLYLPKNTTGEQYHLKINPTGNKLYNLAPTAIDVTLDQNLSVDGVVTITERRYVDLVGQVTDANGLLLDAVTIGTRTETTGLTTNYALLDSANGGAFSLRVEAPLDEVVTYQVKNNRGASRDYRFSNEGYDDYWGSITDGVGTYPAWLREIQLSTDVEVPVGQDDITVNLNTGVALQKAAFTVLGSDGFPQENLSVYIEFRNTLGDWSYLTTVHTDTNGIAGLYLPVLNDVREGYRYTTQPVNTTSATTYILRDGETQEFVLDDTTTGVAIDSEVVITIQDRRYVDLVGQVTDANGLLLDAVTIGTRTETTGLTTNYAQLDSANGGSFSLRVEAPLDEVVTYQVKNNRGASRDYRFSNEGYDDYWGSITDGVGTYEAWLREIQLSTDVEVPVGPAKIADFDQVDVNLVVPLKLHKFSAQVRDKNGYPLTGTQVKYNYLNRFGDATALKTLTIDGSGEVGLYIPNLQEPRELYEVTVTDNGFYGFEESTTEFHTLTEDKTFLNITTFVDIDAPKFVSRPRISYVSDTQAVVQWFTDEPSKGQVTIEGVDYVGNALSKKQSIIVDGLTPGNDYIADVTSSDASGNDSLIEKVNFTTLLEVDSTPAAYFNEPMAIQVSATQAVLSFTADEPITSIVEVKQGDSVVATFEANELSSSHQITVDNLMPLSQYQLVVVSTDAAGNESQATAPLSVETKSNEDVKAPIYTLQPVVRNISQDSVTIYWETDEPAISAISYNLKAGGNHIPLRSDDYSRVHVQTLTGLTANTEYEFTVSVTDAFDNGPRLSKTQRFYTRNQADTDAPLLLSDVAVLQLGESDATLVWATDEAASAVLKYGQSADNLNQSIVIAEPRIDHLLSMNGLTVDSTYFYQVVMTDTSGNNAESVVASFTTKPAGENSLLTYVDLPGLLQVKHDTLTIGLRTNRAAYGEAICYGDDGEVYDARSLDARLSQQLTVTGLSRGRYYQCHVASWTQSGERIGSALTGDTLDAGYIRTLEQADTTAPGVIGGPTVVYVADSVAVIEWRTNELSLTNIEYRQSDLNRYQVASAFGFADNKQQIIKGLASNTEYRYRLALQDMNGNLTYSGERSFTTLADADDTAPVFDIEPYLISVLGSQVTIGFNTDKPVDAQVLYTREGSNRQLEAVRSTSAALDHRYTVDLGANQNYSLKVRVKGLSGHTVESSSLVIDFTADADANGLTDLFESTYAQEGVEFLADGDADNDGVSNIDEQRQGTHPLIADTDYDGVADNLDLFPLDGTEYADADNDGVGDNVDNLNEQLGQVYVFEQMLPNVSGDWYFEQVVASAADDKGTVSVLEFHGADDVRLKQYNTSDNGRMVKSQNLGHKITGWQKIANMGYSHQRWHIVAYHIIDGQSQWLWHQLARNGRYIKSVALDGVSLVGEASDSDIADVYFEDDGLSVLATVGGEVSIRALDEQGLLTSLYTLLEVGATAQLQLSQTLDGSHYAVAEGNQSCGVVHLYDVNGDDNTVELANSFNVDDYQQDACGVLQDIALLDNGNLLIDAQRELYEIDSAGGLVRSNITLQTGSDTRYLSVSGDRRYIVGNGLLRKYDDQLKLSSNYSAFGGQNGFFADDSFSIHGDIQSGSANRVWTVERNTARVQLFNMDSQNSDKFERSFTLKDTNNRILAAQDMTMGLDANSDSPRLFVIENTDSQTLLHRFSAQGGWGGQLLLPAGYVEAIHVQNEKAYILARSSIANINSSNHVLLTVDLSTDEITTLDISALSARAFDLTGDGRELFILHESVNDNAHLSVLRLSLEGETLANVALPRLPANSDASELANISYGQNRLIIGYGPEVYMHQVDQNFSLAQAFDEIGYSVAQNALASNVSAQLTQSGKLVWADTAHGRLQVLQPTLVDINAKAIIVAGGGDYIGNNLWPATLQHAIQAYRTLRRQGFAKDKIYYLSDEAIDFDGNGELDELFLPASSENIQAALDWADSADSLTAYLVDHGNVDTFRVKADETMAASEFANMLNGFSGRINLVYDACKSGSFIDDLEGENRTIITSANDTQDAMFLQDGAISFSGLFWQYIDNGFDMHTAFSEAQKFFSYNGLNQSPQVSVNGENNVNHLKGRFIGYGNKQSQARFNFADSSLNVESGIVNVTAKLNGDVSGLQRVWVTLLPRNKSATNDDIASPVVDTKAFDMTLNNEGEYNVAIPASLINNSDYLSVLAADNQGNKLLPRVHHVNTAGASDKRAVLVAAYANGEQIDAINQQLDVAYDALIKQGYNASQINVLAQNLSQADDVATLDSLDTAMNTWAIESKGDFLLYVAGDVSSAGLNLKGDVLAASTLINWIDSVNGAREGQVTVIVDSSQSAVFTSQLTGLSSDAIVIGSTQDDEFAHWLQQEYTSFTSVFFTQVGQGQTTREAFLVAKRTLRNRPLAQTPYLDVDGDGVSSNKKDGRQLLASGHTLGFGMVFAGDEPLITAVAPSIELTDTDSTTLWAENITSTSLLEEVYAIVAYPSAIGGSPKIERITLEYDGNGRYSGQALNLTTQGEYRVQYFARNSEGYESILTDSQQAIITQSQLLPDVYEVDNSLETASVIEINHELGQVHSLHDSTDVDWFVFYANGSVDSPAAFEILIDDVSDSLDVAVTIFEADGTTVIGELAQEELGSQWVDDGVEGEGELLSMNLPKSDYYYIKVEASNPDEFNLGDYRIELNTPIVAFYGYVTGLVTDGLTGNAVSRVKVTSSEGFTALTLPNGSYRMKHDPAEGVTVSFDSTDYDIVNKDVAIEELKTTRLDVLLVESNAAPVVINDALLAVNEDETLAITLDISDADDDPLTYTYTGLPSWVTTNNAELSGAPTQAEIGVYNFSVSVSDGEFTMQGEYTLTVVSVNDLPQINSTASTQVNESSEYRYELDVSDEDGDTLSYVIVDGPDWLSVENGVLTGTPEQANVGSYTFTIAVSDGSATVNETVTLVVDNINDAPVFTSDPINEVIEAEMYTYNVNVFDEDGDDVNVTLSNAPTWLSLTDSVLTGVPSDAEVGSHEVTLTVSDSITSINQTFTLTVLDNGISGLTLSAPSDITLEANGRLTSVDLGDAIVKDDKDIGLIATADNTGPFTVGEHVINWQVTDSDNFVETATQIVRITDTTAPVFSELPEIQINATGQQTNIANKVSVETSDVVDGVVQAELVSTSSLRSGRHTLTWRAVDAEGNANTSNQSIVVKPLVKVGGQYLAENGSQVRIPVLLSGLAADYPVLMDIQVDSALAHTLEQTQVIITEGQTGEIALTVNDNSIVGDETLSVSVSNIEHAVSSSQNTAIVKMTVLNEAPKMSLAIMQNGQRVNYIYQDKGVVEVRANVKDTNVLDEHSLTWDSTLANTSTDETSFVFDPAIIDAGIYNISATVAEINTTDAHSVIDKIRLQIIASEPVLSDSSDSDGDGIVDSEEGLGDADGDGILDHKDNNSDNTVLPLVALGQDIEMAPLQVGSGLILSLGDTVKAALGSEAESAVLSLDMLSQFGGNNGAPVENTQIAVSPVSPILDFVVSGLVRAGDSISIIVPLPSGVSLPNQAEYMKFDAALGWRAFVSGDGNALASSTLNDDGVCPPAGDALYIAGLNEGHQCVQLTLVDGGTYDADGQANGVVRDPGFISANYAPILTLPENVIVNESDESIVTPTEVSDPENATLTYEWKQLTGTSVSFDSSLSELRFSNPNLTADETLSFSLTVNDGVNSTTDNVDVIVKWQPQALNVTISAESAANEGTTLAVDASNSSDPDGYSLSYQWAQTSGPSVSLGSTNNARISFTAPQVTSQSVITLEVTVTSSDGRSKIEPVSITINNVATNGGNNGGGSQTPSGDSGGGGGTFNYWILLMLFAYGLYARGKQVYLKR
ncbi:putative Ig domain-containing protein [Algibacillus agarilyticus]|uniref:putative Ig domain-containing protein n=1 Tax=Algibacillus agarilyticus TaxID=2234133 RepID=UPI000DD04F11|nr:fibronectin type III domain-containing protein [Algibacillus agarilyticus]